MQKIAKLGLGAMVVFAMMFATTISVVAQEKVVASEDVEVKEAVDVTVSVPAVNSIPGVNKIVFANQWFLLDVSEATDETNPEQQIIELALDPMDSPDAPCDEPSGTPCAVRLTIPSNIDAEDLEGLSVDEAIALTGVEYADGATDSYTHKTP